jgi:2-haloacid dehalogenase
VDRWATFDCYGTLIDWNGGIGRVFERLFGPNEAGDKLRRYHELEPDVELKSLDGLADAMNMLVP